MSIQSVIGNTISGVGHGASGTLSELSSKLQNAIGTASASISSLYDGGFVGLDTDNISTLTEAIETYVNNLMAISDDFAKNSDISGALKGQAGDATKEYVGAIAELIDAYCTTYRNFNEMAETAVAGFEAGDQDNATSISEEEDNIRNEAQAIKVE